MTKRDLEILLSRSDIRADDFQEHLQSILETNPNIVNEGIFLRGSDYKYTLLHVACRKGWTNVITVLISHGADLEAKDDQENTPLITAANYNQVEIVSTLCSLGSNVNAFNKYTETALMRGVYNSKIVKTLLDYGANFIHCRFTLVRAVFTPQYESVKLLLAAGADIYLEYAVGDSAVTMCREYGTTRCKNIVPLIEKYRFLWTRTIHNKYIDITVALSSLELCTYLFLWIFDWLPQFAEKSGMKKIAVLQNLFSGIKRIKTTKKE